MGESTSIHEDSKWGSSAIDTSCYWQKPRIADVLLFKDEQTGKKINMRSVKILNHKEQESTSLKNNWKKSLLLKTTF